MVAIDRTFDRIFEELHEFRTEFRTEMRDLRSDLNHFQDRMVQIGFGLVAVLIAAIVTIVLALA